MRHATRALNPAPPPLLEYKRHRTRYFNDLFKKARIGSKVQLGLDLRRQDQRACFFPRELLVAKMPVLGRLLVDGALQVHFSGNKGVGIVGSFDAIV